MIRTRLGRGPSPVAIGWTLAKPFFGSPERGARTIVYLTTDAEAAEISGAYFTDCRVRTPKLEAVDDQLAARLWRASEELVGLRSA